MAEKDGLNLAEGAIVALPFFENEKFVVGTKRGGGMGNVYQLIPLLPGSQPFALKTYQGTSNFALFEREARIWISLGNHPNVARAITYGMLNGVRCILANWYPRNVFDVTARSLSTVEINRFAAGIISGLKDGYDQHGLIHKDIKPSNILIDNDGAPRLADFGISSITPPEAMSRQIYANTADLKTLQDDKNSTVSGTPIYMAPELFHGAKNSMQTDIFALGVTLFEWITGTHPYLSPSGDFDYGRVIDFAKNARVTFGDAIDPLAKLILLAIHLDADERPATYNDLLERSLFVASPPTRNQSSEKSSQASVVDVISKAQVLRRQGKAREAVGLLNRELDKQPEDVLLLTAYATTLIKLDQVAVAMPYLDRAVSLNRKHRNTYQNQPYIEPNVNRSLLHISAKQFDEAAVILREAAGWLKEANSDLSYMYWEFGWLALHDGRTERAVQRFAYYVSKRAAIEPVLAMFSLAAFMTPDKKDYFRKFFDLVSTGGCGDVLSAQHYCIIASYLDRERLHRFEKQILTPALTADLEKLSAALFGTRSGFQIPLPDQIIRQLLQSVDDKYCGGKYRGIL